MSTTHAAPAPATTAPDLKTASIKYAVTKEKYDQAMAKSPIGEFWAGLDKEGVPRPKQIKDHTLLSLQSAYLKTDDGQALIKYRSEKEAAQAVVEAIQYPKPVTSPDTTTEAAKPEGEAVAPAAKPRRPKP